jgi:MerR family transcriptional regulator, light-induced transcriptional regulator
VPDAGLSAGEAARRLGVAVTTIRTWDRRYGLGPSFREPGRHRRYSERDLARLQLMRRLTIDGVDAAEAARIAKTSSDPAAHPSSGSEPRPPARTLGTAKGLRRAALALDPVGVDRLLALALAGGVLPAWTTVIAPALRGLGSQYSSADRYIAAEHLLSGAVSAALARVPRPQTPPRVLLTCAPEEDHTLPLEALAAALAERGIASRMLGARVPAGALRDALARTGPAAVLIWAHTPATADGGQLAAAAGARPRPVIVAACGPGWGPGSLPDGVLLLAGFQQALAAITELP